MRTKPSCIPLLCCMMLLIMLPLGASTSWYVGTYGDYRLDADGLTDEHTARGAVKLNFDYRTMLGDTGYLAAVSYGELRYDVLNMYLSDYISTTVDSSIYLESGELQASLRVDLSLLGNDVLPYITPAWSLGYRMERGFRSLNPSVTYSGWMSDTVLSNGITVGFSHAPIVELRYSAALGAALDMQRDSGLTDLDISVQAAVDGLVGYLIDWSLYGSFGYLQPADPTVATISPAIGASIRLTPSKTFQFMLSPQLQAVYLLATSLWDVELDATARCDVALGERVYWYAESNVATDLVALSVTSFRVTSGVDVAF